MLPRPGGASMKPADYYTLKGYTQQAELGDNEVDKPMWAEHGGLDFDGARSERTPIRRLP